ncbi:hypothetical protein F5884DRAFT_818019 [Xylogone sp. PMI_703]|nr:hypothetical protein F5884DRAFT_818019 [Xylogone sp. PMI_703]
MSVDKKEPVREGSDDSMDSIPETEIAGAPQEPQSQQKRKGGRKPIYATSEERKQRNRQAQAAFRERRTEYIKQLEETIRVHETNLHNLQTAHRSAADECLMLRYKNSLLERILLEKGIDVQAELRAKTGSPHLGPTHVTQVPQPTVQRAIMNRHHQARRSNSSIAPKIEPGVPHTHQSPQSRPTPSSHASSPTAQSPAFATQGVMTPPASESQLQHQRLHATKPQPQAHGLQTSGGLMVNTGVGGSVLGQKPPGSAGTAGAKQEYDAQADMIEDQDPSETAGPGPYPESFGTQQQQQPPSQQPPSSQFNPRSPQAHPGSMQGLPMNSNAQQHGLGSMSQLLDPYDPMLDMDPFGLSASMQFPTQFSFDTSSMR